MFVMMMNGRPFDWGAGQAGSANGRQFYQPIEVSSIPIAKKTFGNVATCFIKSFYLVLRQEAAAEDAGWMKAEVVASRAIHRGCIVIG
jgi:hypothetical protein